MLLDDNMLAQQIFPGMRRMRHRAGLWHAGRSLQPYTSHKCCLFEPVFPQRRTGKSGSTHWLAFAYIRFKSLWFFIWGFLHARLYSYTSYANRESPIQVIWQYCFQISTQMLINTRRSFEDRCMYSSGRRPFWAILVYIVIFLYICTIFHYFICYLVLSFVICRYLNGLLKGSFENHQLLIK